MDDTEVSIDLNNLCICPLCPENPAFKTKADLLMHYRISHNGATDDGEVEIPDAVDEITHIPSGDTKQSLIAVQDANRSVTSSEFIAAVEEDLSFSTSAFNASNTNTRRSTPSLKTLSKSDQLTAGSTKDQESLSKIKSSIHKRLSSLERMQNTQSNDNTHAAFSNTSSKATMGETMQELPRILSDLIMCTLCEENPMFETKEQFIWHSQNVHKDESNISPGNITESNSTKSLDTKSKASSKSVEEIISRIKDVEIEKARILSNRLELEYEIENLQSQGVYNKSIGDMLEREKSALLDREIQKSEIIKELEEDLESLSHGSHFSVVKSDVTAPKLSIGQLNGKAELDQSLLVEHQMSSTGLYHQSPPVTSALKNNTDMITKWIENQSKANVELGEIIPTTKSLTDLQNESLLSASVSPELRMRTNLPEKIPSISSMGHSSNDQVTVAECRHSSISNSTCSGLSSKRKIRKKSSATKSHSSEKSNVVNKDVQNVPRKLSDLIMCTSYEEHPMFETEEQFIWHSKILHGKEDHKIKEDQERSLDGLGNVSSVSTEEVLSKIKEAKVEHAKISLDKLEWQNEIEKLKERGMYSESMMSILQNQISILTEREVEKSISIKELQDDIKSLSSVPTFNVVCPLDDSGTVPRLSVKDFMPSCETGLQTSFMGENVSEPLLTSTPKQTSLTSIPTTCNTDSTTKVDTAAKQQNHETKHITAIQNEDETRKIFEKKEMAVQTIKTNFYSNETQTEYDIDKELERKNMDLQKLYRQVEDKVEKISGLEDQLAAYRDKFSQLEMNETKLSSLQREMENLRTKNEIRVEQARREASKELENVQLKNRELAIKLEDRGNLIGDYKVQLKTLQDFCQTLRQERTDEKEENEKALTELNRSLQEKSTTLNHLSLNFEQIKDVSKKQQISLLQVNEEKEKLDEEVKVLTKTIEKQKEVATSLSKKIKETQKSFKEKVTYFNSKIDVFVETERSLQKDLKIAAKKCHSKDEELQEKDRQIQQMKVVMEEIDTLKSHHDSVIDDLKREIRHAEKNREVLSQRYMSLDTDYKDLRRDYQCLEDRFRIEQNASAASTSSMKRSLKHSEDETETLRLKNKDLKMQLKELESQLKDCNEKIKRAENEYSRKETELRNEAEKVVHEQSTKHQQEVDNLKKELRNLCDLQETHRSCQVKIKHLEEEHQSMISSMEENMKRDKVQKMKIGEELQTLENTIGNLRKEKNKVIAEKDALQRDLEKSNDNQKLQEEKLRSEISSCREKLRQSRETLHEQLIITQQLQNGGQPWQQEKVDLTDEIEKLKNQLRDANIGKVIAEDNLEKYKREKTLFMQNRDIQEKTLQDAIDAEKAKANQIQIDFERNIETWAQKNKELTKKHIEVSRQVEAVRTERDVDFAKLRTKLQMSEEVKGRLSAENDQLKKDLKKMEREIRKLNLHQNCKDQVEELKEELEEQIESNQMLEKDRKKSEENLDELRKEYQFIRTECVKYIKQNEMLQGIEEDCKNKVKNSREVIAKLEEENTKLKANIHKKSVALQKREFDLDFVKGSEKVLLDKVEKQEELLQKKQGEYSTEVETIKNQIKSLKMELENARGDYKEKELECQYVMMEANRNHTKELNMKDKQIEALELKLKNIQDQLDESRSENRSKDIETMKQNDLKRLQKMHRRELKMKDVQIGDLKEEIEQMSLKLVEGIQQSNESRKKGKTATGMERELEIMKGKLADKNEEILALTDQIETLKYQYKKANEEKRSEEFKTLQNTIKELQQKLQNEMLLKKSPVNADACGKMNKKDEDTILQLTNYVENLEERYKNMSLKFNEQKMEISTYQQEVLLSKEIQQSLKAEVGVLRETLDEKLRASKHFDQITQRSRDVLKSKENEISNLKDYIKKLKALTQGESIDMGSSDVLRTQLKCKDSEISSLQNRIEELQQSLSSIQDKVKEEDEVHKSLVNNIRQEQKEKISKLQAEIDQLQSSNEMLVTKKLPNGNGELDEKMQLLELDLLQRTQDNQALVQKLSDCQKNLEMLRQEMNEDKQNNEAQEQLMNGQIRKFRKDHQNLKMEKQQLEEKIGVLNNELKKRDKLNLNVNDDYVSKIAALEKQKETLSNELQECQLDLEQVRSTIIDQASESKEKVRAVEKRATEQVKKECEKSQEKITALKEKISRLEREMEECKKKGDKEIEKKVRILQSELEKERKHNDALTKQLTESHQNLELFIKKEKAEKNQNQRNESEARLKNDLKKFKTENQTLVMEKQQMKEEIFLLNHELKEIQENTCVGKYESKITELKKQINNLTSELEEHKGESRYGNNNHIIIELKRQNSKLSSELDGCKEDLKQARGESSKQTQEKCREIEKRAEEKIQKEQEKMQEKMKLMTTKIKKLEHEVESYQNQQKQQKIPKDSQKEPMKKSVCSISSKHTGKSKIHKSSSESSFEQNSVQGDGATKKQESDLSITGSNFYTNEIDVGEFSLDEGESGSEDAVDVDELLNGLDDIDSKRKM